MKRADLMTDTELAAEFSALRAQWDAFIAAEDDGHGGSPGEWMVERIGELETEEKRRKAARPRERPLTDQMKEYLAALYWTGGVKGFGFGPGFDSTRKALVQRGLLRRELVPPVENVRHRYVLTPAGTEEAKRLPDPRKTNRDETLQQRLDDVKAGRW